MNFIQFGHFYLMGYILYRWLLNFNQIGGGRQSCDHYIVPCWFLYQRDFCLFHMVFYDTACDSRRLRFQPLCVLGVETYLSTQKPAQQTILTSMPRQPIKPWHVRIFVSPYETEERKNEFLYKLDA